MQPLNKLKTKHDHTLTDWLKFGIFSIMMMAPFSAIASKCVYAACNKNAYQSYYGETLNEENYKHVDFNKMKISQTYYFIADNFAYAGEVAIRINVSNIYNLGTNQQVEGNQIRLIVNNSEQYQFQVYNGNTYVTNNNFTTNIVNWSFTFESYYLTTGYELVNSLFYTKEYNNYSFMDNVFYYAVNQLNDEELFNWTQDTAIYSTINTMCEGLTIQNGALPLLLTYWTFITLIYIVFDLIIGIFTKLTHLLK